MTVERHGTRSTNGTVPVFHVPFHTLKLCHCLVLSSVKLYSQAVCSTCFIDESQRMLCWQLCAMQLRSKWRPHRPVVYLAVCKCTLFWWLTVTKPKWCFSRPTRTTRPTAPCPLLSLYGIIYVTWYTSGLPEATGVRLRLPNSHALLGSGRPWKTPLRTHPLVVSERCCWCGRSLGNQTDLIDSEKLGCVKSARVFENHSAVT